MLLQQAFIVFNTDFLYLFDFLTKQTLLTIKKIDKVKAIWFRREANEWQNAFGIVDIPPHFVNGSPWSSNTISKAVFCITA